MHRELMRRNPGLPPERVEEVAVAATTQIGDQGLTLGRMASLLAGLPKTTPGYSVDRMCAGAMTAVTTTASSIAFGAIDVAIAGGVEHMGRHPMGEGVDPNPRIVAEKLVDPSALVMGKTAENLHDRFPELTKERSDAFAVGSQDKLAKAYANNQIQPDLVPVATRHQELGFGLATADEPPRPGTTTSDLAGLKTPFRPHGKVTAGNSAGLNDGATACVLASAEAAEELGLTVKMRLVDYAFVGVEPEVMGIGPVPAAEKALKKAGLTIEDIGLFEPQRGVRRAGPGVPRPLRHRRRRRARQQVRRSHCRRPPAGLLRRPSHEPAGPPVRGAPRGPLRHDRDVHRHRHGRGRHLGEPTLPRPTTARRPRHERHHHAGPFEESRDPHRGLVRDITAPRRRRHPGADHPRQRLRPHQAQHLRPQTIAGLQADGRAAA